jgi:signal transduction histidine kinase
VIAIESAEAVCRRYPAVADTMRAVESGSLVAAPLALQGRVLGALGLGFPAARRFSAADRSFYASMGQQCAQALVRARLLETEHAARGAAEAALRGRDEVLRVVAHDLGNSLSGVLTTSSALLRTLSDPDALEAVGNIQSAAQQMQRLRRDLLDVAMIDAGQLSVVRAALSPRELVRDAAAQLRPLAAEKEITLEVRAAAGLPRVWADRDRILQVLTNLLVNALKFTPEGGRVVASVEPLAEEMRFSVRDDGPGVAAEHRPHVFNRFWKTQRGNRHGAGLGLAIALGIVEAHQGRLWLEEGGAGGAEFAFTLPLAPPA